MIMSSVKTTLAFTGLLLFSARAASMPPGFSYRPPGELTSGSGQGRVDNRVYLAGMRFPLEAPAAYANSQVWGTGGSQGPPGSQCAAVNYSYPWRDNFCETRAHSMPLCPSGNGHQGQDLRANSCERNKHWVVSVFAGTVTSVGRYSLYVTADDGSATRTEYLHMDSVQVTVGQKITRGQRIGKVSDTFGGVATTIHLHFNIRQIDSTFGFVYVPPYMSLVEAYKQL